MVRVSVEPVQPLVGYLKAIIHRALVGCSQGTVTRGIWKCGLVGSDIVILLRNSTSIMFTQFNMTSNRL